VLQRSIPLRFSKEFADMKTLALVLALAFAAPLAAHAANTANAQETLAQKMAQTYHTDFGGGAN
jgi:hypothetical protein